ATIASGNLTISAGALAQDIDITQTGSGGDARGGTARLGTAGTAAVSVSGTTDIIANAQSASAFGAGGTSGMATGGTATILAQGGSLSLADTNIGGNAIFAAGEASDGRTSTAGMARIETTGGAIGIGGALRVQAAAQRLSALATFAGIDAQGGTATAAASGGSLTVSGNTTI
ncbi:hypothetical protein, partial [Novosphingobium mangrovi (ex Huang et al. 2023)]|nr:hypothetical protein [Novosphingobium mangrovi (ex Huang et al. 2023)]